MIQDKIKEGIRNNKAFRVYKDDDLVAIDSYQGTMSITHYKHNEEMSCISLSWDWINEVAQAYRDWEVIGL